MKTGRFILSGCSGGGKSTLLAALADRGFQTFEEPGRRVVQAGVDPLRDRLAFAVEAAKLAKADFEAADPERPAFFDRSVVDATAALERWGLPAPPEVAAAEAACRYDSPVFLVPPWPEIYETDAERRHGFEAAVAEYDDLVRAYPNRGYTIEILEKASVDARIDQILARLDG